MFSYEALAQGLLQNEDFKTEAELISAGGTKAQLLNDTKIYVTGVAKTLDDAIADGDISGSDVTTKGDLQTFSTVSDRLPVGDDGSFLVADSNETTGLKWDGAIAAALGQSTTTASYSPTLVGFGTISGGSFHWARVGDMYVVWGKFTSGTASATEAQIPLPNGAEVKSGFGSNKLVGTFQRDGTTTLNHYTMLATAGDTFLNIGLRSSGSGTGLTPSDANAIVGAGAVSSFFATVPIEGLESTTQAAIENQTLCQVFAIDNDGEVITQDTEDIPFKTELTDNCGLWDNSGNTGSNTADAFVPSRDGTYAITGSVFGGASVNGYHIHENGTLHYRCGINDTNGGTTSLACNVPMTAGNTYTFRVTTNNITLVSSSIIHYISIVEMPSVAYLVSLLDSSNIVDGVSTPSSGTGKARICSFQVDSSDECSNVIGGCISDCETSGTGATDITFNTSYWAGANDYHCATVGAGSQALVTYNSGTKSATNYSIVTRRADTNALNDTTSAFICHGTAP